MSVCLYAVYKLLHRQIIKEDYYFLKPLAFEAQRLHLGVRCNHGNS